MHIHDHVENGMPATSFADKAKKKKTTSSPPQYAVTQTECHRALYYLPLYSTCTLTTSPHPQSPNMHVLSYANDLTILSQLTKHETTARQQQSYLHELSLVYTV